MTLRYSVTASYTDGVSETPGADTAPTKPQIRAAVRARRAERLSAQPAAQLAVGAEGLATQLLRVVADHGARSVSCYLPIRGEPDTRVFITRAHDAGIELLLPVSRADITLEWVRVTGDFADEPGAHGIPEAVGERLPPEAVGEVDVMFIPACAADRTGVRLGWGMGYYDRTLARLTAHPPVFAVVYDDEIFAALPHEPHDVPVTGVVTPTQVLRPTQWR